MKGKANASARLAAPTFNDGRRQDSSARLSLAFGCCFLVLSVVAGEPASGPFILQQPQSQTVAVGETVFFSAAADGTAPLSDAWRFNGAELTDGGRIYGTKTDTLQIAGVEAGDAGDYSVVISNGFGSVTSAVARLSVVPLIINLQPQNQSSVLGDYVSFGVGSDSPGPLSYQWQFNGTSIAAATGAVLWLPDVRLADVGDYRAIVTNPYGSVTSAVARLTVGPLAIVVQPQNQSVGVGETVGFSVQANSHSAGCQWRFNGASIPGATSQILTLFNVQLTNAGAYTVVVTNSATSVTSAVASLTVRLPGSFDTWRLQRGTPGSYLSGVAYGNGLFVAVGWGGRIYSSPDGVNWAEASLPSPSATDLLGVAFGEGMFVAVGWGGRIYSSLDGVNWVRQDSGTSSTLSSIAYGNGMFVAVGDSVIITSEDGVSWTSRSSTYILDGVTCGNGEFVAVGLGGVIVTSDDGVAWTGTSGGANPDEYLTGVAYGNGTFAAAGYFLCAGCPDYSSILTSTDGITWRAATATSFDRLYGISFGNGTFVAVGDNDGVGIGLASTNGTSWAEERLADAGLSGVAYGNGTFAAVGYCTAVTSPDGFSWSSANNLHSVTCGNGLLAAVGIASIQTSTDGVTWFDRTAGKTNTFNEIIFTNNMFTAVGHDGVILTSTDGMTWTTRQSATTNELHGLAYANGIFVAVGRQGTILTSADGLSWTERTSGTSKYLKDVAYGAGVFVIVGNLPGQFLTSTDAVTWTRQNLPSAGAAGWEAVVYGNGMFVAVGEDGAVATSVDGMTWATVSTGVGENLRNVTYGDGMFLIVGNNGAVLTSSDGLTWASRLRTTGNNLRAVTFWNGRFCAVGNGGDILQSGCQSLTGRNLLREGGFELTVLGESARPYCLQCSGDLLTWIDLLTYTNVESCTVFLDSAATNISHRFYRVTSP